MTASGCGVTSTSGCWALVTPGPLLVVVDDAQWVDPASWSVLSFVANRLRQTRVSFLFASRADAARPGARGPAGDPPLQLGPADAAALVERDGPALEAPDRAAVLERCCRQPAGAARAREDRSACRAKASARARSVPAALEAAFAADLPSLPAADAGAAAARRRRR